MDIIVLNMRQTVVMHLCKLSAIILILLSAGCTVTPDDLSDNSSIEEISLLAQKAKNREDFNEAGDFYMEIDRFYPYSNESRWALVEAIKSYHKGTDLSNARLSAKRYLSLYADGPEAAFAQYMVGLSFFDAIVDVRRDQGAALHAVEEFRRLDSIYPDSLYSDLADEKLKIAYSQLAGQEMSVGRYYMNREEYLAAINRFTTVVDDYTYSIFAVEAFFRLTEAYIALGMINLAKENNSVFTRKFPNSEWSDKSNKLINGLNL